MKKLIIILALILAISILGYFVFTKAPETSGEKVNKKGRDNTKMEDKVNININGTDFTATLEDNETAKELVKRLPLNINMDELNGNEKYYYFDESLPSKGSAVGQINTGDIMLYGSDCLVIFYDTFNSSYSYTKIGKIDNPSSLKDIVGSGSIEVIITK